MKEKKTEKMLNYANGPSLEEINNTVEVPKNASFWRTLLAYSGPGALVAVGYMDPGNWITSIAGGAEYKYTLLSVILLSSLVAMLLQSMAARLGIVTGMDLAQATREHTSKRTGVALWVVTELAIMATDIAEVIGGAVALQLLFGFPLLIGVLITTFDVLLLLLLTKLGFRKIEAIVSCLIAVIFFVFAYEVALADPNIGEVLRGFIPDTKIATDKSMLFLALGIVGATVMPHNLYLHSSIAQARKFDRNDDAEKAKAIRFTTWDSNIQLTVAFVVNCLLLILGGALFYGTNSELGKFVDLFDALKNPDIVGNIASPVLSRLLAIVPVIICVIIYGGSETAVEDLLLYTQVFLSIALPVSIIPLTMYTSDKKLMGQFANPAWVKFLAWIIAIALTLLNLFLIYGTLTGLTN